MVDAANSVAAADRPIAAVALPTSVSPGQNVSLSAAGSAAACGRTISSYAWTVVVPGHQSAGHQRGQHGQCFRDRTRLHCSHTPADGH